MKRQNVVGEVAIAVIGFIVYAIMGVGIMVIGCLMVAGSNVEAGIYLFSVVLLIVLLLLSWLGNDQSYYIERGYISERNYVAIMITAIVHILPLRTLIGLFYIVVLIVNKMEELSLISLPKYVLMFAQANEYTVIVYLGLIQLAKDAKREFKQLRKRCKMFVDLCAVTVRPHGYDLARLIHEISEERKSAHQEGTDNSASTTKHDEGDSANP